MSLVLRSTELSRLKDLFDGVDQGLLPALPDEVTALRTALATLRRRKRFVSYHESGAYAEELRALLEDLEAGVRDPRAGAELVSAVYRADAAVFDACWSFAMAHLARAR